MLKKILNNYERTNYLSSSSLKKLITITGSTDIHLKSLSRAKLIYNFIESVDMQYLDDRLLSVFDTTSFNYKIRIKVCSSDFSRIGIDIDETYHKSSDKITYLSVNIMKMILAEESRRKLKYKKDKEEKKAGLVKYAIPDTSVLNRIDNISPVFITTANHKYYNHQDIHDDIHIDSLSYRDLSGLSTDIKNRINSSISIGVCNNAMVSDIRHIINNNNYQLGYNERLISMFEVVSTIML